MTTTTGTTVTAVMAELAALEDPRMSAVNERARVARFAAATDAGKPGEA